jgi:hypothetical protein
MILRSDEFELVGDWIFDGAQISADPMEIRIQQLIEHHLEKIAVNPESGAWETLYRDPLDGRYWECTYPRSGMHGGEPMRLSNISSSAAIEKYRLQASLSNRL